MMLFNWSFNKHKIIVFLSFLLQMVKNCHSTPISGPCPNQPVDIVFVLDSSSSIWPPDYFMQIGFIENITSQFNVGPLANQTRVGIVLFSDYAKIAFKLGDNLEKRETISAIRRIHYLSGGTNTAEALDLLTTTMFLSENGGRMHVPHVAVVVTDGESHDTSATAKAARMARDNGTRLLAIGVGPKVDETELKLIASDPDDKHVFKVTSYRTLQEIVESMITRTCEVLTTTPVTTTPVTTTSTTTSVTSTTVSTVSKTISKSNSTTDIQNDIASIIKYCGGKPADVYFLLDSSSSIHTSEFKKEVDFVKDLVDIFEIGQNATRVGVSTFSDKYQEVIHFSDHDEKATLLTALDQVPYLGGGTDTANAIKRVRTEEFTIGTARRQVAHILIIMTDGLSRDPFATAHEAKLAKETGMYNFAIGIGKSVDRMELDSIASPSDSNIRDYVFNVTNFEALRDIRNLLAIKTCDVAAVQRDQEACRINRSVDVLFAFDSASLGSSGTSAVFTIVSNLSHSFETQNHVKFGVVAQSCTRSVDISLTNTVSAINFGSSNGIAFIVRRLRTTDYLPQNGGRSNAKKIAILFIDNIPTRALENEIRKAKSIVDKIIAVSIGKNLRSHTFGNSYSEVVSIESVSEIPSLISQLQRFICRN